jgi:hypothetical protein
MQSSTAGTAPGPEAFKGMLRTRTKPGKPLRMRRRRIRSIDEDEQDYEGIMLGSIDVDRPESSADHSTSCFGN